MPTVRPPRHLDGQNLSNLSNVWVSFFQGRFMVALGPIDTLAFVGLSCVLCIKVKHFHIIS